MKKKRFVLRHYLLTTKPLNSPLSIFSEDEREVSLPVRGLPEVVC